ncbi:hypothetical protein ACXWTF_12900 [Thiomicrolovo sp. ZZH C-3]
MRKVTAKEKDTVEYKGKKYKVLDSSGRPNIFVNGEGRVYLDVEHVEYEILDVYYPTMSYAGATALVLGSVMDENGHLVYLDLFGQEDYVKSITSVIMQGRLKMNDHFLAYSEGYFQVHKAGNKRKIEILGEGMVRAIVSHAPSIRDTNFDVIIAPDAKGLSAHFKQWMERTNPQPYPAEALDDIYAELKDRELLVELVCVGAVKAVSIKDEVGINEFELIREITLEVCLRKGLIDRIMQPEEVAEQSDFAYPLPKSPLLTEEQVASTYAALEKIPATYATDGWAFKPVGIKLFGGAATAYVTERDVSAGDEIDGQVNGQIQCFGYVDLGYGGEWGYINFDELIEAGLEMDLYFEDRYLAGSGSIMTRGELEKMAAEAGIGFDELVRHGIRSAA